MTGLLLALALSSTAGSSAHFSRDDDWAKEPDDALLMPGTQGLLKEESGAFRVSRGFLSFLGGAVLGATPLLLWLPLAVSGGGSGAAVFLFAASCFLEPLAIATGAFVVHRLMGGQGAFGVALLGTLIGIGVGALFVTVAWGALGFGTHPFDFNEQLALGVGIGLAVTGAVVAIERHHDANLEELSVIAAPTPGGALVGLAGHF